MLYCRRNVLNVDNREDIMTIMNNDKLGCLIIHGFGGGIFEIESLAEYLTDREYMVACPKLKGHILLESLQGGVECFR